VTPDGTLSTIATGPIGIYGLAFDESGNLFGTNFLENTLNRISASGITPIVTTGLNRPFGLVFGPDPTTLASAVAFNSATATVPEPFTIVGTFIGGTAALRLRKKLKDAKKLG
jgi:hypothetical protein